MEDVTTNERLNLADDRNDLVENNRPMQPRSRTRERRKAIPAPTAFSPYQYHDDGLGAVYY